MAIGSWLTSRIEAGIAATPDWVFVLGPRLLGNFLVGVVGLVGILYGLHVLLGTSMNPIDNFRELAAFGRR